MIVCKKVRCGIFTNIAPIYTKSLWDELSKSENVTYYFFSSAYGFGGIQTIDVKESKLNFETGRFNWDFLKNVYFKNVLIYQFGLIAKCLSYNFDSYIFSGEMSNISCWIAAIIGRMLGKNVIFWGHGLYGNEKWFKKKIRYLFNLIPTAHLLYGNYAAKLLIDSGFSASKVFICYNSLDYSTQSSLYKQKEEEELKKLKINLFPFTSDFPVIIFLGRLTKEKKIHLLLKAIFLSDRRGNKYNCLIVGDGSERDQLQKLSRFWKIDDRIHFYGKCYDEVINSKLLFLADCCVSPGNVGLTAIHSLSLGTPVISHSNMSHQGPEAEAIVPYESGLFFDEDDSESLSSVIDDMLLNNRKKFMEKRCIEIVEKHWNPLNQASIFNKAVLHSV